MEQQLEERYLVLKLKDMSGFQRDALELFLQQERLKPVDGVVVERDWPEYEDTVAALLARDERQSTYEQARVHLNFNPGCNKPPEGWHCTRAFGHAGPCATVRSKHA
jgi:hypothetical protein